MSVKSIYNEIACQYDNADSFGSITQSHNCAMQQIKNASINHKPPIKILDLGAGDGAFLRKTKQLFPTAELTGIDVSKEMLKRASMNLMFKQIEASAAQASQYLPHHSQDLVLAHFINAYVPIQIILKQAQLLTRANGHFSMITSTYESFPVSQQYLANFIARDSIASSIVGHYYKATVKNTLVTVGKEELLQSMHQHQFEVIEHQRLHIPVSFNNLDELVLFGIDGAWFLNSLSVKNILPRKCVLQIIKRFLGSIFTFPYQDTQIIDVILAKK